MTNIRGSTIVNSGASGILPVRSVHIPGRRSARGEAGQSWPEASDFIGAFGAATLNRASSTALAAGGER